MCFSFTASVTAGATLTAAGALTVRLARRRAELPLASVPLLFGVQQLLEALVWWSLDHDDPRLDVVSTHAYMLFSHVLWPVFVPFAMRCVEVVRWRRRAQAALLAVGVVVSLDGLAIVLGGAPSAHVQGSSLQYERPSVAVIALYVVATCGAALLSGRRPLRLIGAGALGLALVTWWLYTAVFVSVWCFFCAVLTVAIFGYFWSLPRGRPTSHPEPRSVRAQLRAAPSSPEG